MTYKKVYHDNGGDYDIIKEEGDPECYRRAVKERNEKLYIKSDPE